MLTIILLVFAFVCFCLAAFWTPQLHREFNLTRAGLCVLLGIELHPDWRRDILSGSAKLSY